MCCLYCVCERETCVMETNEHTNAERLLLNSPRWSRQNPAEDDADVSIILGFKGTSITLSIVQREGPQVVSELDKLAKLNEQALANVGAERDRGREREEEKARKRAKDRAKEQTRSRETQRT